MAESIFSEMKRFVGFSRQDADNLAGFHPRAEPHFGWLADEFYERIQAHPGAREVFDDDAQVERLKQTLQVWAGQLLTGPHDDHYYELRRRIGRVHVEVGLKQHYMFTAMNVIRGAFERIAGREITDVDRRAGVLGSLNKLLDLELAIMLETYQQDHIIRLQRSEQQAALKRLADIGEMAATVAHEVRNPLAGISGAIEILRDDLPPDSPRRGIIKEILDQVRRLDSHVRDLLVYARRVDLQVEPVDPAVLIGGTLALLSGEPMMRGVSTHVSVAHDTGTHLMDRGQIQEVLVNLIRNAARAMNGKGELWIEAGRLESGGMTFSVEDTGPGIPAGKVEDAFRPFFTTWPQGTGLGLSICLKALQSHGGSLTYETGRLGGARFVAMLPSHEDV